MPDAAELASLQLPLAPGGEDPLTAVAGSASSATGGDPCKVVSAGTTHSTPVIDRSGDSSTSASTSHSAGFSLGHGVLTVNVPSKLRPGDVNGLTSYVRGDACRHRILSGGTRFTVGLRPTA